MLINELTKSSGYTRPGKRLGRGNGSGKGNYSGKGCKGQKARTGGGVPAWFEGGQTALYMRLPKLRGFKKPIHLQSRVQTVTLAQLDRHTKITDTVTNELLASAGMIKEVTHPVKIVGNGTVQKKLHFKNISLFSAGARAAIEKAGGSIDA